MAYATSDIISWAKASQPLAAYGEFKKNALTGAGTVDPDLHMKIYIERKLSLQLFTLGPFERGK